MTYATTFSGIDTWAIALDAAGWCLKWQCECDPVCADWLRFHYGVPVYNDVATVENPEPVDVLVGSTPCQPFSTAGEQRGIADERHLLWRFLALAGRIKPRWLLMENVAGLLSDRRAFGEYLSGLASIGFDAVWHRLPASALGAPIERQRLYIVALAQRERREGLLRRIAAICFEPGECWPTTPLDTPGAYLEAVEKRMGEPALFSSNNGNPNVFPLQAYGNAVVPQIPYLIAQSLTQIEG